MEIIKEKDAKITFDVNGIESFIDVKISLTEFDDGTIVLGCQYGDEQIEFWQTSIKNEEIVKNYNAEFNKHMTTKMIR